MGRMNASSNLVFSAVEEEHNIVLLLSCTYMLIVFLSSPQIDSYVNGRPTMWDNAVKNLAMRRTNTSAELGRDLRYVSTQEY